MPKTAKFDLIVYGATSFVGQLLAHYLWQRFGASGELRWALAGRLKTKLETLRTELGDGAQALAIVIADAQDATALSKLCRRTRAVVSTVGPYALYGEPLVEACARNGTDYCDLTGEPQWIRQMIQRHEATAQRSGARLVHSCGFDSIPSDLGVDFLQFHAQLKFGEPLEQIKMRVKSMRGGLSGGTAGSMLNAVKEAAANPAMRRELANPYSLCGSGPTPKTRQPSLRGAQFDPDSNAWVAPFVMAPINTRIVQRSHALKGRPWGDSFRYDEAMVVGAGLLGRVGANLTAAGIGAFMAASALPPTRWFLQKFILPAAGEGPSPKAQASGYFDLRFFGRTHSGQALNARVSADRDPGYGATAKMLGEAAAMLALETPRSRLKGGFWTPATTFGQPLVKRLIEHAGMEFELL